MNSKCEDKPQQNRIGAIGKEINTGFKLNFNRLSWPTVKVSYEPYSGAIGIDYYKSF